MILPSAEYEVVNGDLTPSEYGVQLLDAERTKRSKVFIGGMNTTFPNTQQNGVSAAATTHTEGEEEYKPRKVSSISNTILHEIIHTANVGHPMDDDNTAADVDLMPVKFQSIDNKIRTTYFPSPGADKAKILSNIMIYTITGFMGSTVGKIVQDPSKLKKVSPDQAYIIQKQINEDQNKQKTNSTTNENN